MTKYLQLFNITLSQYFVYRLNFILWRVRVVLNLILIYFLWNAVFQKNATVFGYSYSEILTYVLIISFLSDIVFSSKIHEIGAEIMTGNIINHLLKPISFFSYVITKEIADKTINVTCALIEISLLIMLLQPNITIQTDLATIFVGIVFLMIGIAISFFISFCTSMIAFWTAEIWAPRFIYLILVFVLAGNYFPLDILPQPLYNVLLFTPFPYFMFLPAHIFIKGATSGLILPFIIGTSWACITFIIARILWKKGMKEYSFYGR